MIIVDGYNVIYKWKSLRRYSIELAKDRLINALSNYQGYTGEEIILVLDSSTSESAKRAEDSPRNIKVIYAPNDRGADIFIEQLVSASKEPHNINVITADVLERTAVLGNGANTTSPEKFEEEVARVCGW